MKKFISLIGIIFVLGTFVFVGAICRQTETKLPESIILNYWRIWDEKDTLTDVIAKYQTEYSYVKIIYRKFRYEEYEDQLITAWAKGEGPDIFAIPNNWVNAYLDFAEPLPPSTTMKLVQTFKKYGQTQTTIDDQTKSSYTIYELDKYFADVVSSDVVFKNQIYGLPYSVDTLALFYNKELLNQSNIPLPPKTWEEFIADVKLLTKQDSQGNIVQSGAALGTSQNIPRSADILSLLMMQSGSDMISGETVTFHREMPGNDDYYPGQRALQFYTDFASPTKEVYSWNDEMPDALEQFVQGNLAFFFGYSYHRPTIITKAGSSLDFDITNMPQINQDDKINYPNYLVEMVSNKSEHTNEAWDFIKFAVHQDSVISYLNATRKPTALKGLIPTQMEEEDIKVFVSQVLTAKSWYHGIKPVDAEQAITDMVDQVLAGEGTIDEIVDIGAKRVQLTM